MAPSVAMRPTFHLLPTAAWAARDPAVPYAAPSLDEEGFIHCTDGVAELLATANRYYRQDPRPYVALTIDLDAAGVPWRFDDPSGIYPHVYGAIPGAAVVAVTPLIRDDEGRFIGVEPRMSDVAIREYREGDGGALRALWVSAGFRLIGDDDPGLARFVARNPGGILVAESAGSIVGSAMGAWDGRRGWLYHVATSPERRGQGLASELVRRLEEHLRSLGCERVVVLVETSNAQALAFWEHRGYEIRPTRQLGKTLPSRPPRT